MQRGDEDQDEAETEEKDVQPSHTRLSSRLFCFPLRQPRRTGPVFGPGTERNVPAQMLFPPPPLDRGVLPKMYFSSFQLLEQTGGLEKTLERTAESTSGGSPSTRVAAGASIRPEERPSWAQSAAKSVSSSTSAPNHAGKKTRQVAMATEAIRNTARKKREKSQNHAGLEPRTSASLRQPQPSSTLSCLWDTHPGQGDRWTPKQTVLITSLDRDHPHSFLLRSSPRERRVPTEYLGRFSRCVEICWLICVVQKL